MLTGWYVGGNSGIQQLFFSRLHLKFKTIRDMGLEQVWDSSSLKRVFTPHGSDPDTHARLTLETKNACVHAYIYIYAYAYTCLSIYSLI